MQLQVSIKSPVSRSLLAFYKWLGNKTYKRTRSFHFNHLQSSSHERKPLAAQLLPLIDNIIAPWKAHPRAKIVVVSPFFLPQPSHVKMVFRFLPWTRRHLNRYSRRDKETSSSTNINNFIYIMSVYTCIVKKSTHSRSNSKQDKQRWLPHQSSLECDKRSLWNPRRISMIQQNCSQLGEALIVLLMCSMARRNFSSTSLVDM